MKQLTKAQQEKLAYALQVGLSAVIIGIYTANTIHRENIQAKKLARKRTRQISALQRQEYKLKKELMKQKYQYQKAYNRQQFFSGILHI